MTSLIVSASDLREVVSWAGRAVPTRPHAPVVGGLLLDAAEDRLTVSGYDYETCLSTGVDATVTAPGRVLVSARLVSDVAATLGKQANVELSADGSRLAVREGRSEWRLPLLPVEDYPLLPGLAGQVGTVDADTLKDALSRVAPAAGRDDVLPMLTGIKIESDGDRLTLAATDRFRLACTTIGWSPAGGHTLGLLVAPRLLDAAVKASRAGEQLVVHHDGGNLGLATDTHRLVGRLLDAEFPRWRGLLPTDLSRYVIVEVAGLAAAVSRAAVVADRVAQVRLAVDAERIVVSAGGDDGSAQADTLVHELVGDPITIGVNPAYLADALKACGSERVRICLGVSATRPMLLIPDSGGSEYRHLLMPVRLADRGGVAA